MINFKTISALVDELELATQESSSYTHRETGEIFTSSDDMLDGNDDEYEDEDEDEIGEQDQDDKEVGWLAEAHAKLREIENSDDWVRLPSKFDVHEWAIMRDFAISIKVPELHEMLLSAIHGRGAFRNFKDTVFRGHINDKWDAFRQNALTDIILGWLASHNIPVAHDANDSIDAGQEPRLACCETEKGSGALLALWVNS